jgi:glycogen operon protein
MFLSGQGLDEMDERGRKVSDTDFLLLMNSHYEDVGFTLPTFRQGSRWIAWMDTSRENGLRPAETHEAGEVYPLQARSMVVLMERHSNGSKKEETKEESNEATS